MKRHLVVLVLLVSCTPATAMRAAENGDRAALRTAVVRQESAGSLSNGQAASLAREVADREIRTSTGFEATERVHDAWPCAHELDGALAERMKTHDDAGALSALARIDGRGFDLDDARAHLGDSDGHWRSVGGRGLVRTEDHAARLQALRDPDPLVRREAARASRDASDPSELGALAEAARVDPDFLVRTEAVRAIAALKMQPNDRVANILRDVWASADDGLKEDIALAWAGPMLWNAGGEGALRVVVASDHGPGAIEAAAAILRHKDAPDDVAASARAQLLRSMEQGSVATRLQAIAEVPLDRPEFIEAMQRVAEGEDSHVRVGALSRLAQAKKAGAVEKLEALAQPGSPVAQQARFALAGAGDRSVQAWLEQELTAEQPFERLSAATALAELGVSARAAPLLADDDASVRVRAACTILMAARRH